MQIVRIGQGRFFYGWIVVAVLSAIGGWTLSMGGSNVGFFVGPMRDELGFDRAIFGWATTARMLMGAASGVLIGRLIDRFGPRVLLAVAGGLAGALTASAGVVNAEWQFVLLFALMGLLGMQGTAVVYAAPTVAKWFVRTRPKAMGMLFLGVPISLTISFPLTQWLIGEFGWRNAWIVLGLVGVGLAVPLSLIFLRRQPEDVGLRPDGDAPDDAAGRAGGLGAPPSAAASEHQWTRREALKTVAFWQLTLVFAVQFFCAGSVSIFRIPHMIGNGISPTIVSYAGSAEGAISMIPAFAMGWFTARMGLRRAGASGFFVFAAGVALITLAAHPAVAFAATMTWGIGISMVSMLQNVYFPAFFGRAHIGAIRGVSLSVAMVAGAVAGPLTGYVADSLGGFEPIWWPVVASLAMSGLVLLWTKPPTPSRLAG